jgi:hypothetical protein
MKIMIQLLISFLFLIQASSSLALSPKTELRLLIAEQASEYCITKGTTISLANVQISSPAIAKDGSGWVRAGLKSARATGIFHFNFITKKFSCNKKHWEKSWEKLRKIRYLSWDSYTQDSSRELLDKWNNGDFLKSTSGYKKTCWDDLKLCTENYICYKATTKKHGGLHWKSDKKTKNYVYYVEAKRRELDCNGAKEWEPNDENQALSGDKLEAQTDRAIAKLNGDNVIKDQRGALELFLQSAKHGSSEAQYWLGKMYKDGNGVLKDYKKSYMWFNIAQANGYYEASSTRDIVGRLMNLADEAKAQDMSRRCLESDYTDC